MSKNLTRKGIAFGAMVALGASVLAGAPALADNNGPISLLPFGSTATNSTFNSIIGAGLILTAEADPSRSKQEPYNIIQSNIGSEGGITNVYYDYLDNDGNNFVYVVENPSGSTIQLYVDAYASNHGYAIFDTDGTAVTSDNDSSDSYEDTTEAELDNYDFNWNDSGAGSVRNASLPFVANIDTEGGYGYMTNAKKIVIGANDVNINNTKDEILELYVNALGTSTVEVKVQALADTTYSDNDEFGKVNTFELTSKKETLTFYPVSAVSAVTKITKMVRGEGTVFAAEVRYNNGINPRAVEFDTRVDFIRSGTTLPAEVEDAYYSDDLGVLVAGDNDGDFEAGVYTARAYFSGVRVGSASAIADLSNGQNTSVTNLTASVAPTKDVAFEGGNATVRVGSKAVVVSVQAETSIAALEASNIQVRATVTATELSATSATTVSGSSVGLAETDDVVVAYGRTNSKGIATFTVTNAGAVADDVVSVKIEILNSLGFWVDSQTLSATWEKADLASFDATPGKYVSGANPTVTFVTKDQFGQPIDVEGDKNLSVNAYASIGGIKKAATYDKTVTVSGGKAVFTFANFATAGESAELVATLKAGSDVGASNVDNVIEINVYNTLGTDKISVVDSFENAITYKDFVTGDSTDVAVAEKLAKVAYSSSDYETMTGTVTNLNSVGQPGIPVEIAGAGLLFKAGDIYATDKITAYANEYGVFTVDVFAHTVNVKGIAVSFTSDGKTASTLLKTYLPTSMDDKNLKFSWALPAVLVKNTTYTVVASLSDKWNNPVSTSTTAVVFRGTGSVEVNTSSAGIDKNFGKDGKVTVFVRSVKDIAGPGSVSATLGTTFKYPTGVDGTETVSGTMGSSNSDDTATAWDESLWSNELSSNVEILESTPVVSASVAGIKGFVNVTVRNSLGKVVTVTINGKVINARSPKSDKQAYSFRSTAGKKTVVVKVAGKTVSTRTITVK